MSVSFLEATDFGPLSSRDIATVLWLFLFICWSFSQVEVRNALTAVLQAALKWKIVILCLLFWCSLIICVGVLGWAGFWKLGLLKDTVLWGTFTGLSLLSRSVKRQDETSLLRSLFYDSLAISVAIDFLSNLYTFSLWVELVVIPIFTLLMVLHFAAQKAPNGKLVEKLFGCLTGFGGLLILVYLCFAVYHHSQKLATIDTLRQFLLPFILTALSVPTFFLIALFARYESLFILQNIGETKNIALRFYVQLKLIDLLRFNLTNIGIVHRRFINDIISIHNHDQADLLFKRLRVFLKTLEGGIDGMKSRSIERVCASSKDLIFPIIPLFRAPWDAIEFVMHLGLKDTAFNEPPWRSLELGEWYSLADLSFESGQLNWKNHISCMHTSSDEAFIEKCRWKIDILDPDSGNEVHKTVASMLAKYLARLGCEIPRDLLVLEEPAREVARETSEAWFIFRPLTYKFGHGWELSIKSKFPDLRQK